MAQGESSSGTSVAMVAIVAVVLLVMMAFFLFRGGFGRGGGSPSSGAKGTIEVNVPKPGGK